MIIYSYMIPVYALLVEGGTYSISPEGNDKNLPVVPESYRVKVAEFLVAKAGK